MPGSYWIFLATVISSADGLGDAQGNSGLWEDV